MSANKNTTITISNTNNVKGTFETVSNINSDLVKVLQRLSVPALLGTSSRKLGDCCTVSATATSASVTHSRLCGSHANRAHEACQARRTFIMGVCAVSVRLHKTRYVKVARRAPARAPA